MKLRNFTEVMKVTEIKTTRVRASSIDEFLAVVNPISRQVVTVKIHFEVGIFAARAFDIIIAEAYRHDLLPHVTKLGGWFTRRYRVELSGELRRVYRFLKLTSELLSQ